MDLILDSLAFVYDSAIDVAPIAIFLFAFQRFVIGDPMPNRRGVVVGFLFVVIGLGLFLVGLEQTLFPLGRLMAEQLTNPDSCAMSLATASTCCDGRTITGSISSPPRSVSARLLQNRHLLPCR